MAVSNQVSTLTKNYLVPKVAETVLLSNVGFTRFVTAAKPGWDGAQVEVPVKWTKNSNVRAFKGADLLPTGIVDNRVKMTFDAAFNEIDTTLAKTDMALNDNPNRVISLVEAQMMSDAGDLASDLGRQFYGDGTGQASKELLGLAAIVDDGTSVATIGGLSRSTYTSLKATVTASGGTLTLAKMSTLYNNCTFGPNKPTVGLVPQAVFSLYEQLLVPMQRIQVNVGFMKGITGGTGFTGLDYKGFPILPDQTATAGYMYFLNEDSIDFYAVKNYPDAEDVGLKMDVISGSPYEGGVKGLGFKWTGWVKVANQEVVVGRMIFAGNFVPNNPRFNGVLTGITSV